jgi:hypothetical protein
MKLVTLVVLAVVCGWTGCDRQATPAEHADAQPPPVVVIESPGTIPEPPGLTGADAGPNDGEDEASAGRTEIVATDVACQQDSDCVKATCCHATTCVAAGAGPDCTTVACTADCRAGSMDCNGGCRCQAGKCAAKLWFAPSGW